MAVKRLPENGFLGPIGDDLPSLIPLIFALMMFFYVFTLTWNAFDERGRAFEDAVATLRIGNALRGNNYLRGIDTFNQRCIEAQSFRRIKFVAGLVELSTGPGQQFQGVEVIGIEDKFFSAGEEKFFCTNSGDERPDYESTGLILRSFPVALEFKNEETGSFYVRPMLLVVVTWR